MQRIAEPGRLEIGSGAFERLPATREATDGDATRKASRCLTNGGRILEWWTFGLLTKWQQCSPLKRTLGLICTIYILYSYIYTFPKIATGFQPRQPNSKRCLCGLELNLFWYVLINFSRRFLLVLVLGRQQKFGSVELNIQLSIFSPK